MMRKICLQVPATSANCGPGYDTLGLACTLYNQFSFEILEKEELLLEVKGEGAKYLRASYDNLTFKAFFAVWNDAFKDRPIGLKVTMHNNIPMSRGLGSSSSAIVAGVYAAAVLSGKSFSKEQLLNYATAIEGHPDNVAPAIYGGFTISYMEGEQAHSLKILPAKPLKFIAVVPEKRLATSLARKAIPKTIPHVDAVFNVSRASLLVGALLTGEYNFLGAALEDKLHQPYRAHLIPGLEDAFQAGKAAGAHNVIISGAGSTIMAYADFDADCVKIAQAICAALQKNNLKASYHILDLDTDGVKEINL